MLSDLATVLDWGKPVSCCTAGMRRLVPSSQGQGVLRVQGMRPSSLNKGADAAAVQVLEMLSLPKASLALLASKPENAQVLLTSPWAKKPVVLQADLHASCVISAGPAQQ